MDTALAGLIGAGATASVALVGSLFGGRRDEIRALWAENRARGVDLQQERTDRQAAEARWIETVHALRSELADSEARCDHQLAQQEARCQEQLRALEARVAGLGGA
jgi:hypothetical protein